MLTNSTRTTPDVAFSAATPSLRRAQTACLSSMRATAHQNNCGEAPLPQAAARHNNNSSNTISSFASCAEVGLGATAASSTLAGTTSLGSTINGGSTHGSTAPPLVASQTLSNVPTLPPIANTGPSPAPLGGFPATLTALRAGAFSDVVRCQGLAASAGNGATPTRSGARRSLPAGDLLVAAQMEQQGFPPLRPASLGREGSTRAVSLDPLPPVANAAAEDRSTARSSSIAAASSYPTLAGPTPLATFASAGGSHAAGHEPPSSVGSFVPKGSVGPFGPYNVSTNNFDTYEEVTHSNASSSSSRSSSGGGGGRAHALKRGSLQTGAPTGLLKRPAAGLTRVGGGASAGGSGGDQRNANGQCATGGSTAARFAAGNNSPGSRQMYFTPFSASARSPQKGSITPPPSHSQLGNTSPNFGRVEELVIESGSDCDSDASSMLTRTPLEKKGLPGCGGMGHPSRSFGAFCSSPGARKGGGLTRNQNHSTHSLTGIANGFNSFLSGSAGASPFGKMVVAEDGSPGYMNDSMSPTIGGLSRRGLLGGRGSMSPLHGGFDAGARRMSLLPPGGKKEIKKPALMAEDDGDYFDEMVDETERAFITTVCDFNKLHIATYPKMVLTSDLTSILTELVLSENMIEELPDDAFPAMRKLQRLDLAGNRLSTIPHTLLHLPQLEVLLLDHNRITHLPLQAAMASASEDVMAGSFLAGSVSRQSSPLLGGQSGSASGNPSFNANSNFLPAPSVAPTGNPRSVRSGSLMQATGSASTSPSPTGQFKPLILPKIKRVGLAYNDLKQFPTELLHYAGPDLGELVLSSNPDLFTSSQPSLADFERCRVNNKAYKLTLAVDNRPRFVTVMEREGWLSRLPWLTVEWEKIYPDKVLDFLFLGSLRTAQTPQVYEDLNIGFILTAGRDLEVVVSPGMKQLEIAVDDLPGENMIPLFEQCFAFIDEAKRARKGVLIHCFAGLSRSVTITAAYLMKTMYPMTRDEAMILIRQSRKAAMPNRGFMENLLTYEKQLRTLNGNSSGAN